MSTTGHAYGEQLPVPRRRGPLFGHEGPSPELETEAESGTPGPLDRRTEAILGLAIVTPVMAAYVAAGYGVYALVTSVL
jgi:hypothetical protein